VDAVNKYGQTALNAACKNGNIDIVNSLLKYNSNINLCDISEHTPLYNACSNGHTDIVQILLDNNYDIPDDAIHGACEGGYKDIVEILIKHNVDIKQCDGLFGNTPIYYACSNGHTDIVQIFHHQECHNYCQVKSVQYLYDHYYRHSILVFD
jgi:ankyrin repeat protein